MPGRTGNLRSKWVIAALALLPVSALAADAALERASAAMGASDLKSLRYSGDGIGYTFGQAYKPGMAWPKIKIQCFTRTVNYETGSMRDEIVFTRDEPLGGGGYPHVAQQRNDQYVSGDVCVERDRERPCGGTALRRRSRAPAVDHAARRDQGGDQEQRDGADADAQRPAVYGAHLHRARPFASRPRTSTRTAWSRRSNRAFPIRCSAIRRSSPRIRTIATSAALNSRRGSGSRRAVFPSLDLTVREVQPNAPADIAGCPTPCATRRSASPADKVADGVWFIAGGSHNSVAIEMKDHMILVETPLNDGRTRPVHRRGQEARSRQADPLRRSTRTATSTIRAGCARRSPKARRSSRRRRTSRTSSARSRRRTRSAPTALAKSGKKAKFMTVDDKLVLNDGTRSVEIYHIADSHHTDTFLMVYLPKEKLLIEADSFTPRPPNTPPPAQPNPQQHEPGRQPGDAEPAGRPDPAAARPRRAGGRALHRGGDEVAELTGDPTARPLP